MINIEGRQVSPIRRFLSTGLGIAVVASLLLGGSVVTLSNGDALAVDNKLEQLKSDTYKSVNNWRAKEGKQQVFPSQTLDTVAQQWADHLAKTKVPSEHHPTWREDVNALEDGWTTAFGGDNLAFGYANGENLIRGWYASPMHKETMMDPVVSRVGFGMSIDEDGTYYNVMLVSHNDSRSSANLDLYGNTKELPTYNPAVTVTPDSMEEGSRGTATVNGTGFGPNERVTITTSLNGKSESAQANQDGKFEYKKYIDTYGASKSVDFNVWSPSTEQTLTAKITLKEKPVYLPLTIKLDTTSLVSHPENAVGITASGTANSGEQVTITGFGNNKYTVTADAKGSWRKLLVVLPTAETVEHNIVATGTEGRTANVKLHVRGYDEPEADTLTMVPESKANFTSSNKAQTMGIAGVAKAGSTVTITGFNTVTAKANSSGQWTATQTIPAFHKAGTVKLKASVEKLTAELDVTINAYPFTMNLDKTTVTASNSAQTIRVYGTGEVGETVTVTGYGSAVTAKVNNNGEWSANVTVAAKASASNPTLTAKGSLGNRTLAKGVTIKAMPYNPSFRQGDVITRDTKGVLWNYGNLPVKSQARKQIGSGWNGFKQIVATDFNSDGVMDLIGSAKGGQLYLYPGLSNGGFGARKTIGTSGWANLEIRSVKMKKTDKYPTIVARFPNGTVRKYASDGKILKSSVLIGSGWQSFKNVTWGYIDGDNNIDAIAQTKAGNQVLYRTNGSTFINEKRKTIGGSWSPHTVTSVTTANPKETGFISKYGDKLYFYGHKNGGIVGGKVIGTSGWKNFYIVTS